MTARHPLADTYERMLRERLPNLFRLYLNPFVAQTCFCLGRYAATTWDGGTEAGDFQTFLANGFDEALSRAVKLARYHASLSRRPSAGLLPDAAGRLGPFAAAPAAGGRVEFVPGLDVAGRVDDPLTLAASGRRFGFVVLVAAGEGMPDAQAA